MFRIQKSHPVKSLLRQRVAGTGARGFTLIELLVATVVFLIGMSGVSIFSVQTGRATARANSKMTANAIGGNLLELVTLLSYQSATTRLANPWTTYYDRQGNILNSATGAFFTATATLLTTGSQPTSVSTVVSWTEPSNQYSMQQYYQGPLPQLL